MVLFETAIGTCGIDWSEHGIVEILMPGSRSLRRSRNAGPSRPPPESVVAAIAAIVGLLDGEPRDLRSVVLDVRHVDGFCRDVYAATREIPPGSTSSYGEIAAAIGRPTAAREVGAALGRNPFPIIVPCHRVLSASGALHGFSAPGGIVTKRRMLELEKTPGFTQVSLF